MGSQPLEPCSTPWAVCTTTGTGSPSFSESACLTTDYWSMMGYQHCIFNNDHPLVTCVNSHPWTEEEPWDMWDATIYVAAGVILTDKTCETIGWGDPCYTEPSAWGPYPTPEDAYGCMETDPHGYKTCDTWCNSHGTGYCYAFSGQGGGYSINFRNNGWYVDCCCQH